MLTWKGNCPFEYPKIRETTLEEMPLPCYATPKIDGELNFLYFRKDSGNWVTVNKYGRFRSLYPVTAIAKLLNKNCVYVGELYAGDSLYDFLKVKDNPFEIRMCIFDVLNPSLAKGYMEKMNELPLSESRFYYLSKVPVSYIDSREKLETYFRVMVFAKGMEGIVCRTMNDNIFKIKPLRTIDVVVIGVPKKQKSLENKEISTLLLGLSNGKDFVACGKVGSGISKQIREELYRSLLTPNNIIGEDEDFYYVKPKLVVEIECNAFVQTQEYQTKRTFRNPRFKRFRFDKLPEECTFSNQCPELLYTKGMRDGV